jgi:two-component system, OmpR family, KDP operon response regulator KdpE
MGLIAPETAPTGAAARALVVNAEPQCLVGLRIVLRGAGYIVESARTAADALALVADEPPDVLVLDLALPDGVGAALCAGVRQLSAAPILILSPPDAQRERLLALNAGADDYVPKPFRRQELLGRLSGVVPASVELPASSPLELGDLVIDPARRRVSRAGAVLLLEPAEFELVRVLAQHRGRLLTDRQLLRAAWGEERGAPSRHCRAFARQAGEGSVAFGVPDR